MPLSFCVDEGSVGHSVGRDGARRNAGQTGTRGAARTFAWDLDRRSTAGAGLGGECRGIQDGIRETPVNQRERRSRGQWAQLERRRHVAGEGERIVTLRHLVVEQLHSLNGKVFQEWRLQVPGEFLVEAFGGGVGSEDKRCTVPGLGEFTAGEREPSGSDGIEGDVSAVETDGLSLEEISERFVGRSEITQRARRQGEASHEVLIQAAIDTETDAKAGAIARDASRAILKDVLTPQADVAAEAEASHQVLQRADFLVFIFRLPVYDRQRSFRFRGAAGSLISQSLGVRGGLLRLNGRSLRLLGAALHFLRGSASLLSGIQQLLQLGLQLVHLLALSFHLLLLRGNCFAQSLNIFRQCRGTTGGGFPCLVSWSLGQQGRGPHYDHGHN